MWSVYENSSRDGPDVSGLLVSQRSEIRGWKGRLTPSPQPKGSTVSVRLNLPLQTTVQEGAAFTERRHLPTEVTEYSHNIMYKTGGV